jgi:hypothetical protein
LNGAGGGALWVVGASTGDGADVRRFKSVIGASSEGVRAAYPAPADLRISVLTSPRNAMAGGCC